jgi:hypothetical protein
VLPVYADGALYSTGGGHFAHGDGEVGWEAGGEGRRMRRFGLGSRGLLPVLAALVAGSAPPAAGAGIIGYHDSDPAVLIEIDPATGADTVPAAFADCNAEPPTPINTLFSTGFVSGLALREGVLYGLEYAAEGIFLVTIAGNPSCAVGSRVGEVGFDGLEALAYVPAEGVFYSVDFDDPNHQGQLIRIDPATGAGTAIGQHMADNVRVTGLAYDALADTLYGVTSGFGGRASEFLTINRATGAASVVGATGLAVNALESLELDTSVSPSRLVAAGTALYVINRSSGAATLVGGTYPNTVYALAAPADADGDGVDDDADNCPGLANPDQADHDEDGEGDACDADDDNDEVPDVDDAFPFDPQESVDTDDDGTGDNADPDDDDDGMPDAFESAHDLDPLDAADADQDADGDGFTNLEEFLAETDPRDPNSRPRASTDWLPLLLED